MQAWKGFLAQKGLQKHGSSTGDAKVTALVHSGLELNWFCRHTQPKERAQAGGYC